MEDGSILNDAFTYRWVIISVLWIATEAYALFNKEQGDTFTAHVRRLFSLESKGKLYGVRRTILVALFLWIGYHFFGGYLK